MKNILSYCKGSTFTGKEITDWCKYQIENNTSHIKEAKRLYPHYNLKPDRIYELRRRSFGPGADMCRIFDSKIKVCFVKKENE